MSRPVRVRQREVDMLARGSHEAAAVTGVLLQRHRERMRLPRPRSSRSGVIAIFAFDPASSSLGPDMLGADRSVVPRQRDTADRRAVAAPDRRHHPVTADAKSLIVQEPVPPAVVHGFADVKAPGRSLREADLRPRSSRPFGGRTSLPAPEPSLMFTCAVNVCVVTHPVRHHSA